MEAKTMRTRRWDTVKVLKAEGFTWSDLENKSKDRNDWKSLWFMLQTKGTGFDLLGNVIPLVFPAWKCYYYYKV